MNAGSVTREGCGDLLEGAKQCQTYNLESSYLLRISATVGRQTDKNNITREVLSSPACTGTGFLPRGDVTGKRTRNKHSLWKNTLTSRAQKEYLPNAQDFPDDSLRQRNSVGTRSLSLVRPIARRCCSWADGKGRRGRMKTLEEDPLGRCLRYG